MLAAAAVVAGCPDEDGVSRPGGDEGGGSPPGGDGGGGSPGGASDQEAECRALCERLAEVGLLCGRSELGGGVATCVDACAGAPEPPGLPDAAGLDCAALWAALPARQVLPCMCRPDPAAFPALAAGPLAACGGCHPAFVGEGGYEEVVRRIEDPYDPGGSSLFCNAAGCAAHPGGEVWAGAGACERRQVAAWVQGAAGPGDDCEAFDEPLDCVSACGDEPAPAAPCDAGGRDDAEDFCRFATDVQPALGDCAGCHGGAGGLTVSPADPGASYDALLPYIDRADPPQSLMLRRAAGEAHPALWQEAGCPYQAALHWIARTDRPPCPDGP